MPFYKDSMSHGNLCIIFEVEFPKKGELKPEQIATLKKVFKLKLKFLFLLIQTSRFYLLQQIRKPLVKMIISNI